MKLTVDFSDLHSAVKPLQYTVDNFLIRTNTPLPTGTAGENPEEGNPIGDINKIDGREGILKYDGCHVMLYIPDQGNYIEIALADGKHRQVRKVHVAECSTISDMRQTGRFEKYIKISRLDGKFPIFGFNQQSGKEENGETDLGVCKNCLTILNYKGYESGPSTKKYEIFSNFTFEGFFEDFSSYFKSLPLGSTKSKSTYTSDWATISAKLRAELNYTCEQCGVQLGDDPKLIHVHHINGLKADNSRTNLRALCADCHKKQPYHQHLYVSNEDTQRINELRRAQHKFDVFDYDKVLSYADSALEGLLIKCKEMRLPVPEIGMSVTHNSKIISIDLCWPRTKVAVLINMDNTKILQKYGWNVFAPFYALSNFDRFQSFVR